MKHRELSLVLCGDREGWDGGLGGRYRRKGTCVCIQLVQFAVEQKPVQHRKAVILQ